MSIQYLDLLTNRPVVKLCSPYPRGFLYLSTKKNIEENRLYYHLWFFFPRYLN